MNLLAAFAPNDAPTDQFEAAGITHGRYTPVSSVNLTLANATAIQMVSEAAEDPANIDPTNNGWFVAAPQTIGTYGRNYAFRTVVAISSYLALRNPFAVYPNWSNTTSRNEDSSLILSHDDAILFTFSGKPPIQQAGFGSLTAYGSDYFLIPNQRNVYALGDRSNITYSDGIRVYGNTSNAIGNDGAFQILLQPADIVPPANWSNNWLLAPAGGGQVIPQLRFYGAEQALIHGSYMYPVLEKITAIKAGGSASGNSSETPRPATGGCGPTGRLSWRAVFFAATYMALSRVLS